jgi:nucleotide-binding universal stress UspA family protein
MYDRILVPLDGSPLAEEVIPYALALARSMGVELTLLRVAEHESEVTAAKEYVQPLARRLNAEGKVLLAHMDPASTILGELEQHPHTLAAMTTHGRAAVLEVILGSVALRVVRDARRPVLIYRPRGIGEAAEVDRQVKITTVMAPLDGSDFSESMLPHAAEMAKALKAKLALVQVLSTESSEPPEVPPGDVLESSYIHGRAEETRRKYGVEADWEVLHGHPADAICEYLNSRHDVMLAMSFHARAGLRETIFGSVTHECVRRAGVPVLVYRPEK